MESIVLANVRRLSIPVAQARTAIVRSLRSQGFTLTTEQVSVVAGKRGSQIAGSVQHKKLPLTVKVVLETVDGGCQLDIRLADAWRSPAGKVWGMNGPYEQVMAEVQAELDALLAPFSWQGAAFESSALQSATADVALLSRGNAAVVSAGGSLISTLDDHLGKQPNGGPPKSLKDVVLRGSRGIASFDRAGVQGLLTVGLLVSMKPGAMPANLASDVERFSARIEQAMHNQPAGTVTIELGDDELPVAEFLGQQAAIRDALAVRVLHVCTTCKFEKLVNPDFERLQAINQKKKALTGLVGATISAKGVSPFVLVGSLLKLKVTEIAFVCPRCQGLEDDTSLVTFCPQCGDRRDEAVLRRCPRCQHAFAAPRPADDAFWKPEPPPLPSPAPLPSPTSLTPTSPAAASRPHPAPPTADRDAPRVATFAPPAGSGRSPAVANPPAAWCPDPTRRHQHRYWDGTSWTAHVADGGRASLDPL